MSNNVASPEEIQNTYGIDVTMFPKSSYYINDATGMLVVFDRSQIAFEGSIKPKDTVYGSFSDTYFYYFSKIEGAQ
jgi:hypothetical protein